MIRSFVMLFLQSPHLFGRATGSNSAIIVARTRQSEEPSPGDRRVAGGLRVVVDHHILLIEGEGAI
jgi:hypothetical protein